MLPQAVVRRDLNTKPTSTEPRGLNLVHAHVVLDVLVIVETIVTNTTDVRHH